jgi:hypothetical protein
MDSFLSELVTQWSVEELTRYIDLMEARVNDTRALIKELKVIRATKLRYSRRDGFDNGTRGGK